MRSSNDSMATESRMNVGFGAKKKAQKAERKAARDATKRGGA